MSYLDKAGDPNVVATGTATLVAGTVTVTEALVNSTTTKVFLTCSVVGGTQGILSVGTIVDDTSFDINSSDAADTSDVNWMIVRI